MTHSSSEEKIPFWRDERFWHIALQVVALVIVLGVLWLLWNNASVSLQRQGRQFNFNFLRNEAGFNIGETLVPYTPNDRYYWAIIVGLINTLRLILVGFVLTTIVGVIAGVTSFSENWLVRKLSQVYVEVIRNTPLLLQLFIWYFGIFYALARSTQPNRPNSLFGAAFISNKGIVVPWPPNTALAWISTALLAAAIVVAIFLWRWRTKLIVEQGASGKPQLTALIVLGIASLLLLTIGLNWQFPSVSETGNIQGGLRLSIEYTAVLAGLVFYTGAFIAEIVRAGIQSVSKGQWEAARALGIHSGLVMQLVVFPQALRVIIPSLNSQYMNLAKNSSLALAIGYPDIYSTANTTFNQTGRPIEVFMIIMAIYLSINLIITVIMNLLNQSVQLKER